MATIRAVLAEDNVLLREGVSRLVSGQPDLEVVGVAGDLPGLLAVVEKESPDVVVTDILMPPTGTDEGIRAAAWLRQSQPQAGVVASASTPPSRWPTARATPGSRRRSPSPNAPSRSTRRPRPSLRGAGVAVTACARADGHRPVNEHSDRLAL